MKVELGGDTLETWGYDRDNGTDAALIALTIALPDIDFSSRIVHE
jgi:hypothetical protein